MTLSSSAKPLLTYSFISLIIVFGLNLFQPELSRVHQNQDPTPAATTTQGFVASSSSIQQADSDSRDEEDVSILRESSPGEFFTSIPQAPSDFVSRSEVNRDAVLSDFYSTHADTYDFLIIIPTRNLTSNNSVTANNIETGFGLNEQHNYPKTTKSLKSSILLEVYPEYTTKKSIQQTLDPQDPLLLNTLMHEIAHHWCCYARWPGMTSDMHYSHAIDLFDNNPHAVDLMEYGHWVTINGKRSCIKNNDPHVKNKFSTLTLYLMGLLPKAQVVPMTYYPFSQVDNLQNSYYNNYGPDCSDAPSELGTKIYTVDDIISIVGVRTPTSENSQKSFTIGYVIVTDQNTEVPEDFVQSVKAIRNNLPNAWYEATGRLSSLINKD